MIRIAFKTTGCKVNQADGEAVRLAMADLPVEFVALGQPADIVVINACAVTRGAERDGRVFLHRGARLDSLDRPESAPAAARVSYGNPSPAPSRSGGTLVILAGCMATRVGMDGGDALLPAGVRVVPGTSDRSDLIAILRAEVQGAAGAGTAGSDSMPGSRIRPLIKIQDGCDCHCSFCIVPALRGKSRSVSIDEVLPAVEAAAAAGCAEIVLAGVDVAAWGRDLVGVNVAALGRDLSGATLPDLLQRLTRLGTGIRFRLSSIEPHGLTDRLLDVMAAGSDVCPHLHVPLQSASDRILLAMRRPYSALDLSRRLDAFARAIPGLAIGCDVIVGFPGETEADFNDTVAFIESMPITYLHVFPFSARPGTDAASLPDEPPHAVKIARSRILRDMSNARRALHAKALVGRTVEVVDIRTRHDAVIESLAGDYTRVLRHDRTGAREGRSQVVITLADGENAWSNPWSQPAETQ